jgi:hypothetical protein
MVRDIRATLAFFHVSFVVFVVVMDRSDYDKKMQDLLDDQTNLWESVYTSI